MFTKGQIPWNKGKPWSRVIRKKLSEAHMGHIPWNKGLTKNDHPGLMKLSQDRMGSKNPRWGKHHSAWNKGLTEETDERVKKIAEASRNRPGWLEGKHWSKAMRKKLSEAHKHYTKEQMKNILRRRTPTSLEKKFGEIMTKYKLPYKFVGDGSFIIDKYNPDFINTDGPKIAIEVYARYHKKRNHINIEEWKEMRTKVFKDYGWQLIFFDETEINEENILKHLKGG